MSNLGIARRFMSAIAVRDHVSVAKLIAPAMLYDGIPMQTGELKDSADVDVSAARQFLSVFGSANVSLVKIEEDTLGRILLVREECATVVGISIKIERSAVLEVAGGQVVAWREQSAKSVD